LQEGVELTLQAESVVATDRPTTSRAAPGFLLCLQETLHAIIADGVQIFYHAHVVLGAVALVQAFQAFAGVILAIKTEPHLAFAKQIAAVCHVSAVLPPWNAARTIGSMKAFLIQIQFLKLVGSAKLAIHPAWSNQIFFHFSAADCLQELDVLDDQIRFPPILADGPLFGVVTPAPGNSPGAISFLGLS